MSSVELVLGRGIAGQRTRGPVGQFRARILVLSAGPLPDLSGGPVVLDDASISPRATAPKEVLVDALAIVAIIIAVFAIIDLFAITLGPDSRDLGNDAPVGLTL
jgi:hypothetical protein